MKKQQISPLGIKHKSKKNFLKKKVGTKKNEQKIFKIPLCAQN
jgi:hypothetical protein